MSIKRNILLNPGPATTSDSVKQAQVVPDICPRETEFGDLMNSVSEQLTRIVADCVDYTSVLFAGSGTAVVDAVLSSVVPRDKKILIVNNGAYGKRMCQIAAAYEMDFIEFESSGTMPIDLLQLETVINQHDNISHLAVVHNETTTGLLNDLTSIGQLSHRHNLQLIVDAMSSFAAIPIDMQKQHIQYLTASSNKNIQGMAGIGFVIAKNSALENTQTIKPRNFYLNLYAQFDNFRKSQQMRFTPPVQTLYALKQAIIEFNQEGIEKRYARYSDCWTALIQGLAELDLTYLVKPEHHSRIITSINEPDIAGYDFDDMHDYLYQRGFTIYPGKIDDVNTFRIANIGDISRTDIEDFLLHLADYLRSRD